MQPTLVFDYDGTIHNTIVIYEKAFRAGYQWLVSEGYIQEKFISREEISKWLGMNSKDMWDSFQPQLSDEIKDKVSSIIGNSMVKQILENGAIWYPGTDTVLNELLAQGYNMVILSNCKTAYKEANWKEFRMNRWFLEFYDCQTFNFAPKTEIIKTVQKDYPGELIVIGDRKSDLDCARACRAPFVGCLYGFGEKDELKSAEQLVSSITELPDALKNISDGFCHL